MEEKKLTDEEVVKAWDCCYNLNLDCDECPCDNWGCGVRPNDIIVLIHRLQGENELLKSEITKECQEHLAFAKLAKKADEQQKAEIMQLASENDYLKSERDNLERTLEETGEELKDAKAEIEKLKSFSELQKDGRILYERRCEEYKAEIERLTEAGNEAVRSFTRMETLYKIKCQELEIANKKLEELKGGKID